MQGSDFDVDAFFAALARVRALPFGRLTDIELLEGLCRSLGDGS